MMYSQQRVAQLIFARVEPAYSPQRKSGYQTVCQSSSLSAAEVSAIEQRVQCFQQQSDITRRQFFRLESGKFVFSHTRLLAEPDTTIIDSTGRLGAFIAHCLILTPAQFAELDNNPFAIFDHYAFRDDPRGMVDLIEQTAADGHHCLVRFTRVASFRSDWPIDEARKLVSLALRAEESMKKGQSILMIGDQDDIITTLQTAFALLPAARRPACSFDTCIDRCSVRPGQYWAVGASMRQSYSGYIDVDVKARRVGSGADVSDSANPYLSWLDTVTDQGTVDDTFMARAVTVQALSQAFNEGSPLPQAALNDEACVEFFERNRPRVTQNLKTAFKTWVDTPLSAQMIDYLYKQANQAGDMQEVLGMAACKRIDAESIIEWLIGWMIAQQPSLKEAEWKDVLTILDRAHAIEHMKRLDRYILALDDAELSALEKIVKKRVDIPDRCRAAIQQRRDEIGARPRFFGFLKK